MGCKGREKRIELWSEVDTGGRTIQEDGWIYEGKNTRSIIEEEPEWE